MQTFQMSIMLLFEDRDTINYTEIHEMLQLTSDQIQKHINSLVECKLLLIDGDVSKLSTNSINLNFYIAVYKLFLECFIKHGIHQ